MSSKVEGAGEKLNSLLDAILYPSLRLRLTVLFTVMLAVALIIFSLLLYRSFSEDHQEDFDIALYNHAVDVEAGMDLNEVLTRLQVLHPGFLSDTTPVQPMSIFGDVKIFPFALSRTFMQIRSVDGRVLAASGPFRPFELPLSARDSRLLTHGRDSTFRTLRLEEFLKIPPPDPSENFGIPEDETFRLINFPISNGPSTQLILQIAVPLTLFELQHAALRRFFYVAIPIALLLAAAGGFFLSGRALRPVAQMIQSASQIGIKDLSERLPVPAVRDDLQLLALTMNGLLARVDQAFRSQERFIADASHQLLTPLAILRGEIDTLKDGDPEAMRSFLESASQEVNQLSRTVRDMLLLARVDAGVSSLSISTIPLDEVLFEVAERVGKYAASRGVRLRLNFSDDFADSDFEVNGDRDLLFALFQNLLENAIKYSPENEAIDLSVSSESDSFRVEIADRGPGISEEEIPHLFERFYRSPKTSHKAEGVGLGLAIAQKISEIHSSKLSVVSQVGRGTSMIVQIKRVRRN